MHIRKRETLDKVRGFFEKKVGEIAPNGDDLNSLFEDCMSKAHEALNAGDCETAFQMYAAVTGYLHTVEKIEAAAANN
jgi:hypothetical protein